MRKSWDSHFMAIAKEVATMSTCHRRQVGCVLVDHRRRIMSTGVNGVPPGWNHCRLDGDEPGESLPDFTRCPGASELPGLSDNPIPGKICLATHSEANALMNCPDVWRIHTAYCTTSPCTNCVKMLLSTGTLRIIHCDEYPGDESRELWLRNVYWELTRQGKTPMRREWIKL